MLHLRQTTSTLDELTRLLKIATDLPEGFCLWADYQTAGRGQQNNVWESASGKNLLFSMVIYPTHIPIQEQFLISQLVSLGVKKTLDVYTDGVSVKWPNDIYWHDRKIAGILIENSLKGDKLKHSIIGIGLNVNQTGFAGDFNAVSLRQITGDDHDLTALLHELSANILHLYREWAPGQVRSEYMRTLYRGKGYHPYADADGRFEARITAVEPDGRLVLEDREGKTRKYYMKEVRILTV